MVFAAKYLKHIKEEKGMRNVIVISEEQVRAVEIEDKVSYEFLRDTVNGDIEIINRTLNGLSCDICVNETGKLIPLPPTVLFEHNGEVIETLEGNVVIMKFDGVDDNIGFEEEELCTILEGVMIGGVIDEEFNFNPVVVFKSHMC